MTEDSAPAAMIIRPLKEAESQLIQKSPIPSIFRSAIAGILVAYAVLWQQLSVVEQLRLGPPRELSFQVYNGQVPLDRGENDSKKRIAVSQLLQEVRQARRHHRVAPPHAAARSQTFRIRPALERLRSAPTLDNLQPRAPPRSLNRNPFS